MLKTVPRVLPGRPLFLVTAVATHLVMSFAQTLMHYKLGHHPMGGKFFRNHINFHHSYYSRDHLVSPTYLGDEGNNTPFFFIPMFLVGACTSSPISFWIAFICSWRKNSRWVFSICRLTRVRMRFSTCSTEISLSIRPSTFSRRSVTVVVSRIACRSGILRARCEATVSASLHSPRSAG